METYLLMSTRVISRLPKMVEKMQNMDIKGEKGLISLCVCAKMAKNMREMVFAF